MAPNFEDKLSQLENAIIRIDTNLKWIMGIGGALAAAAAGAFVLLINQNMTLSRDLHSADTAIHGKLDSLKEDNATILDAIRSATAQGAPPVEAPEPPRKP